MLAYLDAASGSMLVSLVVAGGAGMALFFKRGWWHFTALFSQSRRERLEAMRAEIRDDEAETATTDA